MVIHFLHHQRIDMTERIVTHDLSESDVEIILKALENYEKFCGRTAKNCITNGYGTAVSICKGEEWNRKAETIRELESKIANQML